LHVAINFRLLSKPKKLPRDHAEYLIDAFRQGLNEVGYTERKNLKTNTAGPAIKSIGCQHWRPISFGVKWRSSLRWAGLPPRAQRKRRP
jgi:hypothetical protein